MARYAVVVLTVKKTATRSEAIHWFHSTCDYKLNMVRNRINSLYDVYRGILANNCLELND